MITSVRLQNFKAHRDTTVELGRFTVLVGPNGSGKTSVLQAILKMSGSLHAPPLSIFQGAYAPQDVVSHAAPGGPIGIELRGADFHIRLQLEPQEGAASTWSESFVWGMGDREGRIDDRLTQRIPEPQVSVIVGGIGKGELYRFDAVAISDVSPSDQLSPHVAMDGGGTAVALAIMKLDQEEVFERIENDLRRVVPNVERIRVRRVKLPNARGNTIGDKVYFDFRGAPGVPAHAASEGTLITLALLTVLHSPNRPRLLLLDDIDQSLHPAAQIELVRQIKRLLEEMPDLQIVATTHSPYILDELAPEDVHVFALKDDGYVAHKRLSEHPEAARGVLTSGQLWSLDPEKQWVAGESP